MTIKEAALNKAREERLVYIDAFNQEVDKYNLIAVIKAIAECTVCPDALKIAESALARYEEDLH